MSSPRTLSLLYTNLQDGLRSGEDLHLLPRILEPTVGEEPPSVIGICEGRWWARGGQACDEVARILKQLYGVPYQVRVGQISRSDDPPALAWRTDQLCAHGWNTPANDHHRYSHNTGWLAWADDPDRVALRVQLAHLDYASGDQRVIEAQTLACQIDPDVTNLLMGDFNSALSGPHGGDRDWSLVLARKRAQKAMLVRDSEGWRWVKDTRALDTLVGPWDPSTKERLSEYGPGYRALAEIDWEQRERPESGLTGTTVNTQALPIDHILVDSTVELIPHTYRVHLNAYSDHALITARVCVGEGGRRVKSN